MTPQNAAKKIIAVLRDHGHEALLAGGCVRDILLGANPKDFDVATDAPPDRVVEYFRSTKQVGAQFGVVIVRLGGCETEVATFRSDGDYQDGRRPESVHFASAEEDAFRRDFTINGMFFDPIAGEVIDYVGGRADLEARVVRCIGEPGQRFAEDHLRMLRAVRFAARLRFEIAPDTFAAMQRFAGSINRISPERIRMELEMILAHPSRSVGWRLMTEAGLHNHLTDAITWTADETARCGAILDRLPEDALLPASVAAIAIHQKSRQAAESCRELRFSNQMVDAVQEVLEWANRLVAGETLELADLKMLRVSPNYSAIKPLASAVMDADDRPRDNLDAAIRAADAIGRNRVAPPPLIRGDDLLAMGVSPGPKMGAILDRVYRSQLNEEIDNRDAAFDLARELIAESS